MSKSKTKKLRRKTVRPNDESATPASNESTTPIVAEVPKLGFGYGSYLVQSSLKSLWENATTSIILFILPSLLLLLGSTMVGDGKNITGTVLLGSTIALVGLLLFFVSTPASGYFVIQLARGRRPGILESYRKGLYFTPRLIGLVTLLLPPFIIGLLLLVVPGLIIYRRYCLSFFYLIEYDLGIRESMQRSAKATKPQSAAVFGTLGVFLLFLLIGGGFSRTVLPYGSILALIVETLYIVAPAFLYVKIEELVSTESVA